MQVEVTRRLPVPLADAEVADRVREARQRSEAIAGHETQLGKLAADTKATKEEIAVEHREVKRLVQIADAREEPRDVPCRWTYDLATNTASLARLDTGEQIESRAITTEERRELEQRPLFEEQAAQAAGRAARSTSLRGGRRGVPRDQEPQA